MQKSEMINTFCNELREALDDPRLRADAVIWFDGDISVAHVEVDSDGDLKLS